MSVFNLIKDRGAAGTTGILAAVLGASVLLYYWTAPEKKVQDFVGPPRSGYVLTNFDLDSYNEEGKPAFKLVAPHLERREGDESLYINAPNFVLPSTKETNVPPWTGHSQYGWVNKDGSLLKLQGKVHMYSAIDEMIEKLAGQLKKHKEKLKDHHNSEVRESRVPG